MSSSWTERQGTVGDLRSKSKEELSELLQRQEKLLNHKRFIHTLPDKGKKISEFAERVREALVHVQEVEKKQNDLSSVRTQFQAQYQEALTRRQVQPRTPAPSLGPTEGGSVENGLLESQCAKQSEHSGPSLQGTTGSHGKREVASQQPSASGPTAMDTTSDREHSTPRDVNNAVDASKGDDLSEALARVSLSERARGEASGSSGDIGLRNAFLKPHFVEVVERTERSGSAARPKFKTNQLLPKSASPSGSPGGVSPLSAEARRQRDRKHLDDITSAKLPPLHHTPAQLLSLEEAANLMKEQTQRQMELEARMAAQKLSESLSSSMGSYHPEGGSLGAYREVRDDGDRASDDEP